MYICPRCPAEHLIRTETRQGYFFECPSCQGRAMGLPVVRTVVDNNSIRQVWGAAVRGDALPGVDCPICRKAMDEVGIPADNPHLHLDVCQRCHFLWFDPHEFEKLPPSAEPSPEEDELPEVRQQRALSYGRAFDVESEADGFGGQPPDEAWKWIPAMLNMPVEHGVNPLNSRHWATWIVAGLMVLVFALTAGDLRDYIDRFGYIPLQWLRLGGLTLFTSFFLHAGIFHLVSNAYFLLVFGDNVEDHLGSRRFIALLVAATLVGHLLHSVFDPRYFIPCIGASGGISGVIVFYACQFPHARLGLLARHWWAFRWVHLPAWAWLGIWLVMQAAQAWVQVLGFSPVSALAHLGGGAVGLATWLLFRAGWLDWPRLRSATEASTDEIADMFQRIRDAS